MAKTKAEKIADIETQVAQLENQKKKLIQQQKEQERNARTKRLCKRMGLFESMLPDTIPLTEEQFKIFLQKTVTTEHSRRILDGLTAQNAATAAPETTQTAARDYPVTTAKTAGTAQEGGTEREQDEGAAQG